MKTNPSGVVYHTSLLSEVKQHTDNVLSKFQINRIAATITNANISDKDARKQHVRSVRSRHK